MSARSNPAKSGHILVVDVGGNNVKFVPGSGAMEKFASGPELTPQILLEELRARVDFEAVRCISIGCPGPVKANRLISAPVNLGSGWTEFDFEAALDRPVRVINDAVMQALGSYDGGTMLFLGLGTGLGAALVIEGHPAPMEVAHLPYRDGRTFEDWVGRRGLKALGRRDWEAAVHDVVGRLRRALVADYVVLGGGNTKRLKNLPAHCRAGGNANAILGGRLLWERAQVD